MPLGLDVEVDVVRPATRRRSRSIFWSMTRASVIGIHWYVVPASGSAD
jgi:hypothetical protein